jgi:cytochrome c553
MRLETKLTEIWSGRLSAPDLPAVWQSLRMTSIFSIGLITVLVASNSLPARAADGKDLTLNGNGKGAPACSACHGVQGEGLPDAGYPRLAGLNADYLLRQLDDFANNSRENELMAPIAKSFSPGERKAVAAYYASVSSAQAEEPKPLNEVDVTRGAALANEGHWSDGLPACGQCHGPSGQGVGKSFPRLSGQGYSYLLNQLKAWKEGKRSNDPLNLMTGVVSKLSDKEIEAVAAYFASLPASPQQGAKP